MLPVSNDTLLRDVRRRGTHTFVIKSEYLLWIYCLSG
jgi:hypothetical protein